ncbi:DEAD/DEAH box helicase [Archangium lansingense]|uniref:DEAD/DEAH box helicase n=1 Tax=Archangium lansingense TaxID=2995310 RepID=UPI003B7E3C3E
MSNSFKSLGLSPESLGAVRRARFASPTPIQAQAIPPALAGRDVIGCAATGTGKTAAYLLPLVERLAGEQGPVGLVLAPTRELVQQIAQEAAFFGEPRGVTRAVVIGGTDMSAQVEALRQRPTLVLATPGRLADLLQAGAVNLSAVRTLVLDEADRMLEMGFMPELQRILAALPREHQTLLFSATLGHNVTLFAQEVLRRPVRVEVTPSGTPAARAVQRMYEVDSLEKYPLLLSLLARDQLSALVFTRTRERAEKVQEVLKRAGYKTAPIHADRTPGQRRQALEGFRRGQYRCLVATDIASRGLDVEDVGHVINFDLPHSPEDYVHRIGRTARAGASGRASTFVTERDEETVRAIERIIRMPVPRAEVPRQDPVFREELETFQAGQEQDELMVLEDRPRPRASGAKSKAEGASPRRKGASPRREGASPRREGASPRREGASPRREGSERRGEAPRRREATGRAPARGTERSFDREGARERGPGRGTAPRRGREDARRGERTFDREGARPGKPARRGEGGSGRSTTRGARDTRAKSTGQGRSGPRGTGRPGGRAGGPKGGRGGGGRRGR